MKTNEAPEKLYIDSREHWMKSWTAFTTKAKADDIEYIRTDAFIEKATDWIMDNFPTSSGLTKIMYAEDFRKAMKL